MGLGWRQVEAALESAVVEANLMPLEAFRRCGTTATREQAWPAAPTSPPTAAPVIHVAEVREAAMTAVVPYQE